MTNPPFGIVLLAAGSSARLGKAKQLLPYQGTTLIEHAIRIALEAGASEVVVVLGAFAEEIGVRISDLPVKPVLNKDWAQGMGGSIRVGVAALSEGVEAVVVMVCDQPAVTSEHIQALVAPIMRGKKVAASFYDDVLGVPASFSRAMLPGLMRLQGDSGAREVIRNCDTPVEAVLFTGGSWDIDMAGDLP